MSCLDLTLCVCNLITIKNTLYFTCSRHADEARSRSSSTLLEKPAVLSKYSNSLSYFSINFNGGGSTIYSKECIFFKTKTKTGKHTQELHNTITTYTILKINTMYLMNRKMMATFLLGSRTPPNLPSGSNAFPTLSSIMTADSQDNPLVPPVRPHFFGMTPACPHSSRRSEAGLTLPT